MLQDLPIDVLLHILSILPVKALLHVRCVSKSFYRIISHPNFIAMHASKRNKTDTGYIFRCYKQNIVCQYDQTFRRHEHDRALAPPLKHFGIIGSSNGILCLLDCSYTDVYGSCSIYLWNPSLKFLKQLPKPILSVPSRRGAAKYVVGFGFTCGNYDYKIVLVGLCPYLSSTCAAQVYSRKHSLWKRVHVANSYCNLLSAHDLNAGLFFNGACHWLGRKKRSDKIHNLQEKTPLIVAFDLHEEKFREIMLPDFDYHSEQYSNEVFDTSIRVLKESLAVLVYARSREFPGSCDSCDVWVLSGYGVSNYWIKQFRFDIPLVAQRMPSISLLGFGINGEVLIRKWDKELVSYDPETQKYRNHKLYVVDIVTYTESLVLLEGREFTKSHEEERDADSSTCHGKCMTKRQQTGERRTDTGNNLMGMISNLCNRNC